LTGKPVGQDLREGKPTPMLAAATRRADGGQSRVLDRVGADDLSDGEVAAAQQVLLDTGAMDEMEARITQLTEQAIRAIQVVDITAEARDALVELATYVASRET